MQALVRRKASVEALLIAVEASWIDGEAMVRVYLIVLEI